MSAYYMLATCNEHELTLPMFNSLDIGTTIIPSL